jgi:hypothetical protein
MRTSRLAYASLTISALVLGVGCESSRGIAVNSQPPAAPAAFTARPSPVGPGSSGPIPGKTPIVRTGTIEHCGAFDPDTSYRADGSHGYVFWCAGAGYIIRPTIDHPRDIFRPFIGQRVELHGRFAEYAPRKNEEPHPMRCLAVDEWRELCTRASILVDRIIPLDPPR